MGRRRQRQRIGPQPGPQTAFLSSPADIAIFGGSAGGGKSYALILDLLRHVHVSGYRGVMFRRTAPEITGSGGLWDTARSVWPLTGARMRGGSNLDATWPSGAYVELRHLRYEHDKHAHQGRQYAGVYFDELTHFCLTPDHDVLTERGWIPIGNVTVDDRVAGLADDRTVEWTELVSTPHFVFDGDLVEVHQRNGVSLAMTPDHRVVIDRQDKAGSLGFIRAEQLCNTIQTVPRVGRYVDGTRLQEVVLPLPKGRGHGLNSNSATRCCSEDFLELLGWFVAEGSAFEAGGRTPVVSIRQTKPAPDLDALMSRLPWRVRPDGDGGYRIFSRQLFELMKPCGAGAANKRIPSWVLRLPADQMRIVFDAFVRGDGHVTKTGAISIGVASAGLVDDLQAMASLLGMVATSGEYTTRDGHRVFTLSISKPTRRQTMIKPSSVRRTRYVGRVHCLTLAKHGRFLVRRNGRTCWTGNCESQFTYLLTRLRSTSGVKPYVRASTNPDADSWVKRWIDWWIGEDGYPIPERSGVLRWFVRDGDSLVFFDSREEAQASVRWGAAIPKRQVAWFDSREEAEAVVGAVEGGEVVPENLPLSLTFIPSKLDDNVELLRADPSYRARLMAQSAVDRARLLDGNWKIRQAKGLVFKREWFQRYQRLPRDLPVWCASWDCSFKSAKDSSYVVGQVWAAKGATYYLVDQVRGRMSFRETCKAMIELSQRWPKATTKLVENKANGPGVVSMLEEFVDGLILVDPEGGKEARANAISALVEAGNVHLPADAVWVDDYIEEHVAFPEAPNDDQVDATSQALLRLRTNSGHAFVEAMNAFRNL